ncbi:hypothetical protein [Streptomyces sp. NPDC058305]|uniref:hypothetical protein n=1 Tax=Streptomyces sp. NPDC058305 TaxID=3346438 RepID=UPI0036F124B1
MNATPNSEPRPWVPSVDFQEPCESCRAPAGQYCRAHCDTGTTAQDAQRDAERRQERTPCGRPTG